MAYGIFGRVFISGAVSAAILSLVSNTALAGVSDLPKRKPGLWRVTSVNSAAPGHQSNVQQCIDENTDNIMIQQGQEMSKDMCPKQEFRREGSRWVTEAVCNFGGTRSVTKGYYSGDFTSHYKGELNTTYDPPMMGMKEASTTIEAKWLGACKPGQKPGDIIVEGMPGGMGNFNMKSLKDLMKPQ